MSAGSLEASLHATIAALRAENAALRAALAAATAANATWDPPSEPHAAVPVEPVEPDAAAAEEEGHSLPDNRDVDRLLAYVKHASRIYADRDEVPVVSPIMVGLTSGWRIDVCKNVLPTVGAGVHYAIHPSQMYPSEIYFVRDDREEREEDFYAFYDRRNNRVYRSIAGLQAALTATYGRSDYYLVVRAARDGWLHYPLL